MSVKAGKYLISRFGTRIRKTKLCFAFRELGLVVSTMLLLEYVTALDLRKTILTAICKSGEYN
ncbi:Tn3 family transposase [Alteromonas sp. NFXS44]